MDIYPAKAAGLPVFWVTDNILDDNEGKNIPHGKIGTIPYWVESIRESSLEYSNKEKTSLLAELNSTPAIFDDLYCDFYYKECNTVNRSFVSSTLNHLISTELEIIHPYLHQCQKSGCKVNRLYLPDDIIEDSCKKDFGPDNNLQVFMKARIVTINMIRGEKNNWNNLNPESSTSSGDFYKSIQFISQHDKKHIRKITSNLAAH